MQRGTQLAQVSRILSEAKIEALQLKEGAGLLLMTLQELASNITAAIEHLNKSDSAVNLAAAITDFVDYGKTRQRLERLATKPELPSTGL